MPAERTARTRLVRWIGGVATVAALSIGSVVGVAAPASAAWTDCQSGRTCVWKDPNYSTGGFGNIQYSFVNGIADFRKYKWGIGQWGTLNDQVSSVYNNGNSEDSFLFHHLRFTGQFASMRPKSGIASLPGSNNDSATSGGFEWCAKNPYSYICE